jgi:hypothetical protein
MLHLKTLLKRYGARIVVTIVVDATPATVLRDSVASPPAVAQSFQWYFHQYLGLPVTVAVRRRPVAQQRPVPDGRVTYGATPDADVYSDVTVTLVNRQQQIVYAARQMDSVVDLLVAREAAR